jgi:hypothetical protein
MHLETMRSLIDWLKYGTNGPAGAVNGPSSANACIAAVARDATDPVPVAIASFGDETRDYWLARREIPRDSASGLTYPLLGILTTEGSDLDGEVETTIRDGQVSVTIAYAHQQAITEQGMRDWRYTGRALQQSLKQWLLPANDSYRTRNGIIVRACLSMLMLPPFTTTGDVTFSGGLTLRLSVRDTTP